MSEIRKNPILDGVKASSFGLSGWIYSIAKPMLARSGAVTYSVRVDSTPKRIERRKDPRRPVHLQSGKILDHNGRFLTEFTFKNRTPGGVRLRLARRVSLPKTALLYDDQQGELFSGSVVWQRGNDAGARIGRKSSKNDQLLRRLRSPYYAVV